MPKYGDFNKKSDDVCGTDLFKFDNKIKIKTKVNGADISAEGDLKSQKFTGKYSPVDGVTIKKFQATTGGKVVVDTVFDNLMDGLKVQKSFEGNMGGEFKKSEMKIDYVGNGMVSNTKIDVLSAIGGSPTVTQALAFNYNSVWFGAQGSFDLGGMKKYDLGAHYAENDFHTSVKAVPNGQNWNVSADYWQKASDDVQVAAVLNMKSVGADDAATDLTIGTSYKLDKTNTVSAKVALDCAKGKEVPLSFGYSTKLADAVSMDCAASVNALNFGGEGGKFGAGFTFSL